MRNHVSPSMLPEPPVAPPNAALQCLRHRLSASEDARRRLARENLALRQQIQALLRRLPKRDDALAQEVSNGSTSSPDWAEG
jgi:hypothetical protein